MHPSPQAIAAIRDRVAAASSWAKADAEVLADLAADAVANPAPRATVPTPFTVAQVFQAVDVASLAGLNSVAFLPDIRDKLAANDADGCNLYAGLLLAGQKITQADHAAISAIVNASGPDPSWPATVPAVEALLGRAIDIDDVAASRPGA